MASIRVLYLLDNADLGGGETSLLAFLQAALAHSGGIEPHIVVRKQGSLAEAVKRAGVDAEIVDYPVRFRNGALPVLGREATARIGETIDRRRIELVHANNLFGLAWGGAAARKRKLPVVWTCHGEWEVAGAYPRRIVATTANLALCVSESVRRGVEAGLAGKVALATEHLGIAPFSQGETAADRRRVRADVRAELGIAEEVPLIGVVGRFQPIKGHALLFDALPALIERHPAIMALLIGEALFGSREETAEKERLQARAEAADWGKRVLFLGWRDDARRLMRGLDALIVPSASESFGMAAAEGLEAGIPVVATDRGGPREIVEVPATGRTFRSGDCADLAAKIEDALESGSGFDAEAGPRRIAERFGAAAHFERTLGYYRGLIGKK